MDSAARRVLKTQKAEILSNLILNDDILHSLECEDILTDEMIQNIRAERTDNAKIVRLLFILTRRGPNAFQAFLRAIATDYHFLAEKLEEEYEKEKAEVSENDIVNRSPDQEEEYDWTNVNPQNSTMRCPNCLCTITTNQTPRDQPATLVAEDNQFESFPSKALQTEGNNAHLNGTSEKDDHHSDFMQKMLQEAMTCWYTKLKTHMTSRNMRELSFKSPVPVTFAMVDELLDDLIDTVEKCYRVLGAKDRTSLLTHVINLKDSKKKLKQDLKENEKQRNKHCENIVKLENKCRSYLEQIEMAEREKQKRNTEINDLKSQLAELQEQLDDEKQKLTDTKNKLHKTQEKLQAAENEAENLREDVFSYEMELENLRKTCRKTRKSHPANFINRYTPGQSNIQQQRNFKEPVEALTSLMTTTPAHPISQKKSPRSTYLAEPQKLLTRQTNGTGNTCTRQSSMESCRTTENGESLTNISTITDNGKGQTNKKRSRSSDNSDSPSNSETESERREAANQEDDSYIPAQQSLAPEQGRHTQCMILKENISGDNNKPLEQKTEEQQTRPTTQYTKLPRQLLTSGRKVGPEILNKQTLLTTANFTSRTTSKSRKKTQPAAKPLEKLGIFGNGSSLPPGNGRRSQSRIGRYDK